MMINSMTAGEIILAAAVLMAIGLSLLHWLLTWMERKGWIYYRKNKPRGTMRSVFGGVEEFLHPEIRHVYEDQSQRAAEPADKDPSKK